MPDTTAAMLLAALMLIGAAGLRYHHALQPNRAAAVLYLAGTVTWGAALLSLWAAWASAGGAPVCGDGPCESLVDTLEGAGAGPAEFLVGEEGLDVSVPAVTD